MSNWRCLVRDGLVCALSGQGDTVGNLLPENETTQSWENQLSCSVLNQEGDNGELTTATCPTHHPYTCGRGLDDH